MRTVAMALGVCGALTATGCSVRDEEPLPLRSQRQLVSSTTIAVSVFASVLPRAALAATDWIEIGDRVVVGETADLVNSGGGTLRVGVDAVVGSVWSKGPIDLRDRATVKGTAKSETSIAKPSSAVVTGGHSTSPIGATLEVIVPAEELGASQGDVRLEPGQTRNLVPGAYGVLAIKQNSIVRLGSGTYLFKEIMGDSGSKIEVDSLCAPVKVHVQEKLIFRSNIQEVSGRAGGGLAIAYSGPATAHVESAYKGTIFAPNAELILSSHIHEGRFFAKRLRVQPGATITPTFAIVAGTACGSEAPAIDASECVDGLCCAEDGVKAQVSGCVPSSTTASCLYGSSGADVVNAVDWKLNGTGHFMAFTGPGDDVIDARGRKVALTAGAGDDVICGSANDSYLLGGDGEDLIRTSGSGRVVVYPGGGRDDLRLGPGDDIIMVADLCEISPGEIWTDSGGDNYVYSEFSRDQLEAAGLELHGTFQFVTVNALGCHAACGGHSGCPLTDQCGVDETGAEKCLPGQWDSELVVSDWTQGAYEDVPADVRQLIFDYLDAPHGTTERQDALAALRARRDDVVRAIDAELRKIDPLNVFQWREVQVELLGVLGGRVAATLLRDLVLTPPPVFPDADALVHHDSRAEKDGLIRRQAVQGLARMAHAGLPAGIAALDDILANGDDGSGVDEAVVQYKSLGQSPERLQRLRSLLPPDKHDLVDYVFYDLTINDGPQPPESVRGGL